MQLNVNKNILAFLITVTKSIIREKYSIKLILLKSSNHIKFSILSLRSIFHPFRIKNILWILSPFINNSKRTTSSISSISQSMKFFAKLQKLLNKILTNNLHGAVLKSERVEESPSRDAISPFQMVIATILCAMLGGDLPRASHTMHLPNVGQQPKKLLPTSEATTKSASNLH